MSLVVDRYFFVSFVVEPVFLASFVVASANATGLGAIMKAAPTRQLVLNPFGWRERLARLKGSAVQFDLGAYDQPLNIINSLRDHLALVADVREGVHLVGLGGQDPLTRFTTDVIVAFSHLDDRVEEAVLEALEHVHASAEGVELKGLDLRGPSSTWTYLVNDEPFKNQIGRMLTGPGKTSVAIYSAAVLMPLLVLWGLVDRFVGRRTRRESNGDRE